MSVTGRMIGSSREVFAEDNGSGVSESNFLGNAQLDQRPSRWTQRCCAEMEGRLEPIPLLVYRRSKIPRVGIYGQEADSNSIAYGPA